MTDSPRSCLSSFFPLCCCCCCCCLCSSFEPFLSLFVFVFLRLCQLFLSSSSLSALFVFPRPCQLFLADSPRPCQLFLADSPRPCQLFLTDSPCRCHLLLSLRVLVSSLSVLTDSPRPCLLRFLTDSPPRPCQLLSCLSSSLSDLFDRLSSTLSSFLSLLVVVSYFQTLLVRVRPLVSPCTQLFLSLLVLVSPFCLSLSLSALFVSPSGNVLVSSFYRPCQLSESRQNN